MNDNTDRIEEKLNIKEHISAGADGTNSRESSALIIKGAAILAIAGIVSKIFGGIFRIPLTNMIGAKGQSYYTAAYSIYNLLFVIATAGFPVAISRMVSARIALNDFKNAQRSYVLAVKFSAILGLASFALLFFGSGALASAYNIPGAEQSIRALSIAFLFTPVVASMRGYYQGRQMMMPTGLTEVTEQMVRVAVGLYLAYMFFRTSLEKAAAGATFGASAGIIAAAIAMLIIYIKDSGRRKELVDASLSIDETDSSRFKEMISYLVPITIGSAVMPIMFNIDTFMVVRRLMATGWDRHTSEVMFGLMGGYCDPIVGLPGIFIDAICISLMPAVTAAFTLKNKSDLDQHIKTGLKTMMLIAYPCTIGLMFLAGPILNMLYYKKPDEAAMAVPLMQILSLSITTMAIMRTFSTSLQGIGKMMLPVYNLMIGACVKAAVSYFLLGIHSLNINGAPIGSICAYVTAGILNYRALRKYADVRIDMKSVFVKPLIASLIMGVFAIASHKLLILVTGSNAVSTLASILMSVVVYFITIFKTGTVTREEIEMIPKGELIYNVATKLKIVDQKVVK